MASIRGRDTRPELTVRSYLHRAEIRFRLGGCELPGRPDIVFARYRAAVFVHGCFWHRHAGCPKCTTPASRPDFWARKFTQNTERDRRNVELLQHLGWNVITVWECEVNSPDLLEAVFWKIVANESQPTQRRLTRGPSS